MVHIMLVEDDEATLYVTSGLLENAGHVVEGFANADTAYAALAEASPRPDVLVLDYHFPAGQPDGAAIAARARDLYRDTRIIFITGDPMAAVSLGRTYLVLPKPVNTGRLLAAIRAAPTGIGAPAP